VSSLVDLLNDSTPLSAPFGQILATDLLPELLRERAGDGLLVHGPVVMRSDEQAERRFARAVRVPVPAHRARARLSG
jgi:hypothetical protein